jgi:hypothetical protein
MGKRMILYTGCCNRRGIRWMALHRNCRGVEEEWGGDRVECGEEEDDIHIIVTCLKSRN